MWRRAIIANSAAKVPPALISPARSPAPARISDTRGVDWEVIFSTPVTSTTSYRPAAMLENAWKNADPPEAQAASMRVAGTPSIPIAPAMYGARWFCPTKDGPAKLPR
jgi:hypothetical protein